MAQFLFHTSQLRTKVQDLFIRSLPTSNLNKHVNKYFSIQTDFIATE